MRTAACVALGALLAVAGLAMMAAWLFHWRALIELAPGYRMVFATAAGFALAGGALAAEPLGTRWREPWRQRAGAALLALAAVALASHALDRDLGIDLVRLHDWLATTNARPGRMAAPTALGFGLAGAVLVAPARALALSRALIALLGALGVAAFVGNVLNLGALFPGGVLAQIAYPTAVGLVLLAAGLWLSLAGHAGYRSLWRDEGARIRASTVIVVLGSSTVAALAGFALMQQAAERSLRRELAMALDNRTALIERELAQRQLAAAALAAHPDLRRLIRGGARDTAIDLRRYLSSQLEFEFIVVAAYDAQGRELAYVGAPPRAALMEVPLADHNTLAWRTGFELESRLPIVERGERLGELRLRQPLAEMTPALRGGLQLAFCRAEGDTLRCFPSSGSPGGQRRPLAAATAQMHAALAGERGVLRGPDFRGADVIVAYAPVPPLALASILRVETAQLFAALKPQLLALVALLAALAVVSLALLRWQLLPLVGRLARSEDRLRRALEGSRLALWEANVAADVVHLSPQWSAMRGGEPREEKCTVGELLDLVPPEERAGLAEHLRRVLKGELAHYDIEHRVRALDGSWIWVRSRGEVAARDARGRATRIVGTNALITERKEKELAALRDATHDALTGLANRRRLREQLAQALARARRSGEPLAVLYLDMDKLKPVNDTYGHAVGDELLKAFAARLAACVRAADTVARLGGDEFALILETLGGEGAARTVAEKIVAAMRQPFTTGTLTLEVSASIGVALADPRAPEDVDALLERADAALYEAKRAGGDRYALAGDASVASSASSAAGS